MSHGMLLCGLSVGLAGVLSSSAAAQPVLGTMIAAGDEWILSEEAFTADSAAATQLALNIADALAGGQAGASFLAYTTEGRVRNAQLASTLTGAGYGWDQNTSITFDLPTLQTYDAVWLSGTLGRSPGEVAVLQDYVTQGGSVFVLGGTSGTGAAIAAAWNPLLALGGLEFDDDKFPGAFTASFALNDGPSTLDDGVSSIFWGNGQNVFGVNSVGPNSGQVSLITADFTSEGLTSAEPIIGIYQIPAPATAAVLGIAAAGSARRRR